MNVRVPLVFPHRKLLIALVGTVALALLVLLLPVRRAARLRPATRCAMRDTVTALLPAH